MIIDTEGFLHSTSLLHADDDIKIKAGRGALFETTTYDAMGITQNVTSTSSSGFLGIGRKTTYNKLSEWHQIKKARKPMLATTTRGDFIIVLPEDTETAEFKGMFADIAGNFEVHGGNCVLSPLEVATIVECPKLFADGANRISTMLPIFMKTVLKSKGDFLADVRVFKNNGSKIEALGDVFINADDTLEFNTQTKKFTLIEEMKTNSGFFTTKTSERKVEDIVFNRPELKAKNATLSGDKVRLTGQFESTEDFIINARLTELESVLGYGTDKFSSNASNMFSDASYSRFATFARISPTVFRIHGDFIADILDEYIEHSVQKHVRNERIQAAKIASSPLQLQEEIIESASSSGFNFFTPTSVVAPICDGHISKAIDEFWRNSSLGNATTSLLHSRTGADIAANGISTALAAYNSLKTVLNHGCAGFSSLFGIGNIGFYQTESQQFSTRNFTVGSETIAKNSIEWRSTTGNISIAHRVAKADGNQTYTAAGRIIVNPGEDKTETRGEMTSTSGSFNIFTMDLTLGLNRGTSKSKITEHQPSTFESRGTNVFRAGNDIAIVIPQITGTRNVFDAMLISLENKANEREMHSNSNGMTLSTNFRKATAGTLGANFGESDSYDTFLNYAYIRGATDFMRSKVRNQGCLAMNITNKGASYEYIPGDEVHDSLSFAIGLSGLDLSNTDAFAYSLAKSIASAGASAAVGYLASKSGLGGFASTLAASLAGSYVANSMDAQLAPPETKRTKTESKLPQISTASTVSFDHNGNGFKAVNVSMDGRDLGEVIHAVKSQIFDDALAQNLPTEEAVKSVTKCTKLLEDTANSVKSAQEVMKQIDRNCQAKMAEKLIEVADESPIDAQCEAQQVNLTAIVDSILEAADQKIEILNQKIAEIEAQKAAVAESARHSPGAQETLNTVLDSCLDLLKSTREHCMNAIENPTETIALVYSVAKALGEAAMDKTGEMVKFVYENPWGALDSVKGKLSDIYQAVHDDIIGAGLDAAEYAPGGIGSFVEGARDVQGVWITRDRDLRAVTDKWRNYGIFAVIGGKGARKVAKNVFDIVADVSKKDALRNATVLQAQRKIGNVGKFKDLTDGKPFHDGKQAHNFPAQKFLKSKGLNTNDGLSIILTEEQHAKTRTFKRKADKIDLNSSYRDELARDIRDIKDILKEDGSWNAKVRQSLLKGLDNFKKEYPKLFEKVKK